MVVKVKLHVCLNETLEALFQIPVTGCTCTLGILCCSTIIPVHIPVHVSAILVNFYPSA